MDALRLTGVLVQLKNENGQLTDNAVDVGTSGVQLSQTFARFERYVINERLTIVTVCRLEKCATKTRISLEREYGLVKLSERPTGNRQFTPKGFQSARRSPITERPNE